MSSTAFPDCDCEEENLEEQETDRDDLVLRVCRLCGRRHFEAVAEPGDMRAEVP